MGEKNEKTQHKESKTALVPKPFSDPLYTLLKHVHLLCYSFIKSGFSYDSSVHGLNKHIAFVSVSKCHQPAIKEQSVPLSFTINQIALSVAVKIECDSQSGLCY